MSGFESPNYTQTPNDFFDMVPTMEETEVRVTLVMIRKTFGFHRDGFKMGVAKLATAAGLSRQGALDGAEAAEKRGTFRRTNPDAITEAEWTLAVPLYSIDTPLQPVEGTPPTGRGQSRVKERIKKESKDIEEDAGKTQNLFTVYEHEIGVLTPIIANALEDAEKTYGVPWVCDAITEAVKNNARNWKYIEAILKRWKAQGNQESMKRKNGKTPVPQPPKETDVELAARRALADAAFGVR